MRKPLTITALGLSLIGAAVVPAAAQCHLQLNPSTWQEVFRDDFNGSSLDLTRWTTTTTQPNTAPYKYFGFGSEWYPGDDEGSRGLVTLDNNGHLILRAYQLQGPPQRLGPGVDPLTDAFIYTNHRGEDRTVTYKAGMIRTKYNRDNPSDPASFDIGFLGNNSSTPVAYGAYEFRARLATNANEWSTLWILDGRTELDLNDSSDPNKGLSTNVIDHRSPSVAGHDCFRNFASWDNVNTSGNGTGLLTADFNTFTVVWTPNVVTFFVNGRETNSVPASSVSTQLGYNFPSWEPLEREILACMQMVGWSQSTMAEMQIDYIRVLKPVCPGNAPECGAFDRDYANTPYSTDVDFINHDVTAGLNAPTPPTSYVGVSSTAGAIATSTTSTSEVYYRGTDNAMYYAAPSNNSLSSNGPVWDITKLPVVTNGAVAGDVTHNGFFDYVVYRGIDGKLQAYGRTGTPGTWYHAWIDQTPAGTASPYPVQWATSSIANADDGTIYYISPDHMIHRFRYGTAWTHSVVGTYVGSAGAKADLVWDTPTQSLYYKGVNNRLQRFVYDALTDSYTHEHIDNTGLTSNAASVTRTYCIAVGGGKVYYVGNDNRIHVSTPNGTGGWSLSIPLNTQYANPNYLAKGGIAWSAQTQRALYFGQDGRLQYLDMSGATPVHGYIDDYTNTREFTSYLPAASTSYASLSINAADMLFYNGTNGINGGASQQYNHLRYFALESCHDVQCVSNSVIYTNLNRGVLSTAAPARMPDTELIVVPNPAHDHVSVQLPEALLDQQVRYQLFSHVGKLVAAGTLRAGQSDVELSAYPEGIYLLVVDGPHSSLRRTIVKN